MPNVCLSSLQRKSFVCAEARKCPARGTRAGSRRRLPMTFPSLAVAILVSVALWPLLAIAADDAAAAPTTQPKRPRIIGLSHVALFVKNVEQSRAFYKDFLGFAEPYSVNDDDGKLRL